MIEDSVGAFWSGRNATHPVVQICLCPKFYDELAIGVLASWMQLTSAHPLILRNDCGIDILMNRSVHIANRKHMTRFGWAVEGVAR